MSSQVFSGVTMSCSRVPRSRSRTMAMEVIMTMVMVRTMPRMPGTM